MLWVTLIFLFLSAAFSFNLNFPRGLGLTVATTRTFDKTRQRMSEYKQENYYVNGNMDSLNSLAYLSNKDQVLVLLCGIAGSGKSTYARKFIGNLPAEYRKKWTVSNQDALGNRQKVLSHARTALLAKKSVIIDRCNFDVEQRAHWISLAQLFNISTVLCLVMPDYQNTKLCAMRAEERGNSDGIHGEDINWKGVCIQQSRSFQYPTLQEGYSGLFVCTTQQDLECFANTFKDIGERS